jgi:hypothetical protein
MSESERSGEECAGGTPHGADGFPGRFHPAVHGHEPHQANLGVHPGSNYVGYLDDPEQPEKFTITARDATADDLITTWLSVNHEAVVDLGDWR